MTREQVERELREKLTTYVQEHVGIGWRIPVPLVEGLCHRLTPWVMELIEHSQAIERMEMGGLP